MAHRPEGRRRVITRRPARRAPIHDRLVCIPQPTRDLPVDPSADAGRQDAWRRVFTQYSVATWRTPKVRGLARRILSRGGARRVSGPRSASGAPVSHFVGFGTL